MATRLPYRVARPDPELRLFCLPYAGGSAIVYRSWPRLVPDWIEVCPVELPGRGARFRDAAARSMAELVDDLLIGLRPLVDRPVALFGHSMGARIARELARALGPSVVHLFASASAAPHLPAGHRRGALSDADLLEALQRLGGTPPDVFRQPELLRVVLPILRADFALLDEYAGRTDPMLDCPITVFAGTRDPVVTRETARAWSEHTRAPCQLVDLDGGHFFLEQQQARVLQVVERVLTASA